MTVRNEFDSPDTPFCAIHLNRTVELERKMDRIEHILVGNGEAGLDERVRNLSKLEVDTKWTKRGVIAIAVYQFIQDPEAVFTFIQKLLSLGG